MKDEKCTFCRISKKELPAHIVYEDDKFMAFLDINPQTPGHVQVIPREHFRWVWDVPEAPEYFEVARKIALAQRKAFKTEWILSRIIGDEQPHAHIWVFPAGDAEGNKGDLPGNAEKLIEAMAEVDKK